MRIVQETGTDQLFKISLFCLFFQITEHIQHFQIDKRMFFVIQPAVKHHQAEHQPFRIRTEIRFTESKFIEIQAGAQRLFIKALFRNFGQLLPNRCKKLRELLLVGIFGHDGKVRLHDAVLITTVYVFADSLINKRLL